MVVSIPGARSAVGWDSEGQDVHFLNSKSQELCVFDSKGPELFFVFQEPRSALSEFQEAGAWPRAVVVSIPGAKKCIFLDSKSQEVHFLNWKSQEMSFF